MDKFIAVIEWAKANKAKAGAVLVGVVAIINAVAHEHTVAFRVGTVLAKVAAYLLS